MAKQQVSRQRKNAIRQEQRKGTFTSSPVAPNAIVTPRGGAVVLPAAQVHQHQYPAQPIHHHGHGYNVAQDHYQTRPSFESEQSSASIYSTDSGNYSRTPSQGSSSYHGSAHNLNHQGHKVCSKFICKIFIDLFRSQKDLLTFGCKMNNHSLQTTIVGKRQRRVHMFLLKCKELENQIATLHMD